MDIDRAAQVVAAFEQIHTGQRAEIGFELERIGRTRIERREGVVECGLLQLGQRFGRRANQLDIGRAVGPREHRNGLALDPREAVHPHQRSGAGLQRDGDAGARRSARIGHAQGKRERLAEPGRLRSHVQAEREAGLGGLRPGRCGIEEFGPALGREAERCDADLGKPLGTDEPHRAHLPDRRESAAERSPRIEQALAEAHGDIGLARKFDRARELLGARGAVQEVEHLLRLQHRQVARFEMDEGHVLNAAAEGELPGVNGVSGVNGVNAMARLFPLALNGLLNSVHSR